MPISKVKTGSISDSAVTSAKINDSAVTSAKIQDGSIVNADINACAAIASSKLTVDTSALESDINKNAFNISLLGFKMAVNEGLTVFNLVDGVVDEFNDESGTDESEGSNDIYCATNDNYVNQGTPTSFSAGFSMTTITEPDTSTAGTNPTPGSGTLGTYTVPCGATSLTAYVWGAGGASACHPSSFVGGGGGGFTSGCIAVSGGQSLKVLAGEGGLAGKSVECGNNSAFIGGGNLAAVAGNHAGGGGGLAGIFNNCISLSNGQSNGPAPTVAPQIYMIAGSGGGGGGHTQDGCSFGSPIDSLTYCIYWYGGSGGGLQGYQGGNTELTTDAGTPGDVPRNECSTGGGGSQTAGGQGSLCTPAEGQSGGFLYGGNIQGPDANVGGGGAGYYGGGAGGHSGGQGNRGGGGGSAYYGHPQVTCGSTTAGDVVGESGGLSQTPIYACTPSVGSGANSRTNPVSAPYCGKGLNGQDGFVLINTSIAGPTVSTTIVSTAFTSSSVATSARIVVFEEDVTTPTLNTDVIASVSRDGGVTFTNATLSDSGYVTGSSGQRILTGQADISGQPSGQSMRWKLALANNTVKIHGVSLQWS